MLPCWASAFQPWFCGRGEGGLLGSGGSTNQPPLCGGAPVRQPNFVALW